jgi:hypothetical protein
MVDYTANSAIRETRQSAALVGLVTERMRGRWQEFRSWLRYRPERHYMRGRSSL